MEQAPRPRIRIGSSAMTLLTGHTSLSKSLSPIFSLCVQRMPLLIQSHRTKWRNRLVRDLHNHFFKLPATITSSYRVHKPQVLFRQMALHENAKAKIAPVGCWGLMFTQRASLLKMTGSWHRRQHHSILSSLGLKPQNQGFLTQPSTTHYIKVARQVHSLL